MACCNNIVSSLEDRPPASPGNAGAIWTDMSGRNFCISTGTDWYCLGASGGGQSVNSITESGDYILPDDAVWLELIIIGGGQAGQNPSTSTTYTAGGHSGKIIHTKLPASVFTNPVIPVIIGHGGNPTVAPYTGGDTSFGMLRAGGGGVVENHPNRGGFPFGGSTGGRSQTPSPSTDPCIPADGGSFGSEGLWLGGGLLPVSQGVYNAPLASGAGGGGTNHLTDATTSKGGNGVFGNGGDGGIQLSNGDDATGFGGGGGGAGTGNVNLLGGSGSQGIVIVKVGF